MIGIDAQHVALGLTTQRRFDLAHAVDTVCGNPSERNAGGDRAPDHCRSHGRLGRKLYIVGNMRGLQARRITRPGLWQVERAVNERVAFGRDVGTEHANLAVGDLAGRTGILPPNAARRMALFQKASFIDHQHRVGIAEMRGHVVSYDVTQRVRVPAFTTKHRLLSPRTSIAGRLRTHPARLARLRSQ